MSGNDRHDGSGGPASQLQSFRELELLVRNLGQELATVRRRATAEGDGESEALRARLAGAADRVRQMLDRVRFLRQQVQLQAANAGVAASGKRS